MKITDSNINISFLSYEESNRSHSCFNIFLEWELEIFSSEFHFILAVKVTPVNDPQIQHCGFYMSVSISNFSCNQKILFNMYLRLSVIIIKRYFTRSKRHLILK